MEQIQIFKPYPEMYLVDPDSRMIVPEEGIMLDENNISYYRRRERDGGGEIIVHSPVEAPDDLVEVARKAQEEKKTGYQRRKQKADKSKVEVTQGE